MTIKQPATLFGRRLRSARRAAAIPQDKLGVQIGLDELTASARISRYETGIHEPTFDIAQKLANALSVPTAYFYCEDEDLAGFLVVWERLSEGRRKHLRAVIDATLADGVAD
jgi:transcriptional regulator with XRE-family HTH domain